METINELTETVTTILLTRKKKKKVVRMVSKGAVPGPFSLAVQRIPFSSSLSHKHLNQSKEKSEGFMII